MALGQAVPWTALALAGLAFVRSPIASRLVASRIAKTARDVTSGALGRRVRPFETTGGGDFDRLAETLNAMLDRLGARIDERRIVTGSLSRDIRAPLGRFLRQLEAMRSRPPADMEAS